MGARESASTSIAVQPVLPQEIERTGLPAGIWREGTRNIFEGTIKGKKKKSPAFRLPDLESRLFKIDKGSLSLGSGDQTQILFVFREKGPEFSLTNMEQL